MQQFVVFLHHSYPRHLTLTIVYRIILSTLLFALLPIVGRVKAFDDTTNVIVSETTSSGCHQLWVIDTRGLPSDACQALLQEPRFRISRIDLCQNKCTASLGDLLDGRSSGRPVVIAVHGNRMDSGDALERGIFVYQNVVPYYQGPDVDFVIFSWPSDREGILIRDGREKAERTDAEGLYLAWFVRELVQRNVPIAIIGFSFGGRITTGAMHALAGGSLGGRKLPGEHITGANANVGLIAPALEDDWLRPGRYHGMATSNIQNMSILYNRRDAVLRRYWLLEKVRGSIALGFTGPKGLGPRVDGSPMPLFVRDCSLTVGIRHDEKKYYTQDCRAGKQMAKLVSTN